MPDDAPGVDADLFGVFVGEQADDEGNARCALAMFGREFCFSDALGWMHYNGTHWTRNEAEADCDRAILAMLKTRRQIAVSADKEAIVKATIGSARRLRDCKTIFRSLITTPVDAFDRAHDELNVANGVLNLRTKALAPHCPDQRFTYCIPIEYDPAANYAPWVDFLRDVMAGSDTVLDYLQMAVGYTLTGDTSEECLWYIFGPSRSGKGIFTESMLALMGQPLSVEVDFATFTAKRDGDTQNFDLAPLKPTRFVVTSESNKYEVLNAGKIKQLTGGNYVRCAYKHHDLFTYRPQFKAWLVSNQPVNADVDDDALWYRVKVIEFPNSHIGAEDKRLKTRMKSRESLAGILAWAVEGAAKWYAAPNGLTHPAAIVRATYDQRADLDMVQAWIEERCKMSLDTWAAHADLFQNYAEWCKANGVPAKTQKGFSQSLKGKGHVLEVRRVEGHTLRVVMGLSLENSAY